MVEHLLYLRPALERLIQFEGKLGLAGFTLSDENWTLLERLQEILSIFVVATTRLSTSRYPTLQYQLQYFTILLKNLYIFKEKEKDGGLIVLGNACEDGWTIFNEYWKKTDSYSSQVIAMMLDPQLKLASFKHLGLEDEWIWKSKKQLERIYIAEYTPTDSGPTSTKNTAEIEDDPLVELIFGSPTISTSTRNQQTLQLAIYFDEPVCNRTTNLVDWWRIHGQRFPDLANVARDYMSIPASSVPSEQLFSRAGDIITKKRNRLLNTSSSALLLVKSWLRWPEVEQWEIEDEEKIENWDLGGNKGDVESYEAED